VRCVSNKIILLSEKKQNYFVGWETDGSLETYEYCLIENMFFFISINLPNFRFIFSKEFLEF